MKIVFNDATELQVQQVEPRGDYLRVLVVGTTPEQLRELFSDSVRTKKMTVQERGQTIATYERYVAYYRTEIYTGQIYGVVMYRQESVPETQAAMVSAAVAVAQIQAQGLTDEQAITVKAIYPVYSANGVLYPVDFKVTQNGVLYKCLQEHTSQPGWEPGTAPSLWAAVASGEQAGSIEDPIPVPDSVTTSGFEYEYGKYYSEGDITYLCKRGGIPDEQAEAMYGEKIMLYFPPSALVGQYFSIAG